MVYTVTFNPAVDLVVDIAEITPGAVNRLDSENFSFGGKGINVSVILNELGVPTKALGFVAGFTGRALEQGLDEIGIKTGLVHLRQGFTRINVKIRSGSETELNGAGPDIGCEELDELLRALDDIAPGDTLVLAGSVPKSLPDDIYEQIAKRVSGRRIRIAADASGKLLMNILSSEPFVVKPNIHELGEMFGAELKTADEAVVYARELKKLGALNVLVSMGAEGALLIDEYGNEHRCGACRGKVRNSVGAGDSMLAGFIAGSKDGDYEYALKLGTACGGATAFSDGLASGEEICKLLESMG